MQFKDPEEAFENAIKIGALSVDPHSSNFAYEFRYMGTANGMDNFKHIKDRNYIAVSESLPETSHAN